MFNKQTMVRVAILALAKAFIEGAAEAKQQRDYAVDPSAASSKKTAQSSKNWKGEQPMNDEDREMDMSGGFGPGMLVGTILGAIVGAALALWYAPQSGRKTQQLLQRKANKFQKQMNKKASDISHEAEDLAEAAKERVGEWQQQGRSFVDEKLNQVNETAQAVKNRVAHS